MTEERYNIFDLGYSRNISRYTPTENNEMKNYFKDGVPIEAIGSTSTGMNLSDIGDLAFLSESDIEIKDIINDRIDTSEAKILADWTFGEHGAFVVGTPTDGVKISPTGILARKSGSTTFTIDSDGDATFAGQLSAVTGTVGDLDVIGTLTGGLLRTSSSGERVEIRDSDNSIRVYDSSGDYRMVLSGGMLTFLSPSSIGGGAIYSGGTSRLTITTGGTHYTFWSSFADFPNSLDVGNDLFVDDELIVAGDIDFYTSGEILIGTSSSQTYLLGTTAATTLGVSNNLMANTFYLDGQLVKVDGDGYLYV